MSSSPSITPLFDASLVRDHINEESLKALIQSAMKLHEAGEKRSFYDRLPDAEALGTDEALRIAFPGKHDLRSHIFGILADMQEQGLLKPIPVGEERSIPIISEWNALVRDGTLPSEDDKWPELLDVPLARAISDSLVAGGFDAIAKARKEAGLNPYPRFLGPGKKEDGYLPLTEALLERVIASAMARLEGVLQGTKPYMPANGFQCPKTGEYLNWEHDHILDPILGTWSEDGEHRFIPIAPYTELKPILHLTMPAPSGELLISDSFRITGFNDGTPYRHVGRTSLQSEAGADAITKHHFEENGLIYVLNIDCGSDVIKEGNIHRIAFFDEDHDDLHHDDEEFTLIKEIWPTVIGRTHSDLKATQIVDREVLADIVLAGVKAIEENDGKNSRGDLVEEVPGTRDEVYDLIDECDAVRLSFAPGQELHLYFARGGNGENFPELLKGSDAVVTHPFLQDFMIVSPTPLEIDPELVEDADWAWPERYAAVETPAL